jgi:hypothetical protein
MFKREADASVARRTRMVIFNIAVSALVIEARHIPNLPGRKSLKFQGGPREVENVEVEKVEGVKIAEFVSEGYRWDERRTTSEAANAIPKMRADHPIN